MSDADRLGNLPSLIAGRVEFAEEVLAELPDLAVLIERIPAALRLFTAAVMKAEAVPNPMRILFTQAVNEMFDLLVASASGEGRACLKSARSLFELAVTASGIQRSPDDMERYDDHKHVVLHGWATVGIEAPHLLGKDRLGYEHHRYKHLRDTREGYERVLDAYGPGFRRSWSERSLADRAGDAGLGEDYELYRLSSAVLHGSSGGAVGVYAEPNDVPTHRTGPALRLAPLGLLGGLQYFRRIVDVVASYEHVVGAREVYEVLDFGTDMWPEYRNFMHGVDASWWFEAPRQDIIAVLVLYPGNTSHWYAHDDVTWQVRRARAPENLTEHQQDALERQVAHIRATVPDEELFKQPISLAFYGARVEPVADAPWQPANRVLVPEPLGGWGANPPMPVPVELPPAEVADSDERSR